MSSKIDLGTFFNALKYDVTELINTRWELLKLEFYEKSSLGGSILIMVVIVINLIFFSLLFAFIALGFLFSSWVDSYSGGFALVVLLYLFMLAIFVLFRKKFINLFANMLLKELEPGLEEELKYKEKMEDKTNQPQSSQEQTTNEENSL